MNLYLQYNIYNNVLLLNKKNYNFKNNFECIKISKGINNFFQKITFQNNIYI